jgi:hypothetical protein
VVSRLVRHQEQHHPSDDHPARPSRAGGNGQGSHGSERRYDGSAGKGGTAALAEKLRLTVEAVTGLLQTLGNVPSDKIPAKLIEIVIQQVATGQHLALFDPGDPAMKALVNQAKVELDKGRPDAASALLLRAGDDLDISNVRIVRNGYAVITGTATNRSGCTLSHAFVRFNLYDNQGTVVGNALDHASDLAPSDRWAFTAQTALTGTKFATVKLTGVQVFPPAR